MTLISSTLSNIEELPAYVAGEGSIDGHLKVIKLSSNECAGSTSYPVASVLLDFSKVAQLYPSSDHAELRCAIQTAQGFDADRVVCGAGSDEILGLIATAFSGPGTEVVHTRHGFLMYPIFARLAGATPIVAEESNRQVDKDSILSVCTEQTRIVYIANPSNPTGTMMENSELEKLADSLPSSVLLVIDGAYAEFADRPDIGPELVNSRENVVITRTFSKIYGLAGLRVGYGFGPKTVMDTLNRIRAPFNVSAIAQAAAVAAIGDKRELGFRKEENKKSREWLREQLIKLGIDCDESQANFLLARFKDTAEAHACDRWLRNSGIIVRRTDSYQLPHCLRITVGDDKDCKAVVESIKQFRESSQT